MEELRSHEPQSVAKITAFITTVIMMMIIAGCSSQGCAKSELKHRPSARHMCVFVVLVTQDGLGKRSTHWPGSRPKGSHLSWPGPLSSHQADERG